MRIVCDLDGVVFDFDRTWIERYHAWFPGARPHLRPGLPQLWGDIVIMAGFDSSKQFWAWWSASGGWEEMDLYPQAVDALWALNDEGHQLVYATNRPKPDTQTGPELVRLEFPQAVNLRHVQAKWEIPGDAYIEDAPHNLVEMDPVRTIRIKRPWNDPILYPDLGGLLAIDNLTPSLIFAALGMMGDLKEAAGLG